MSRVLVIGVGNAYRRDDAAGLEVARSVATRVPAGIEVRESGGEAASLVESWDGCDEVILVDAIDAAEKPGHVLRWDAGEASLPSQSFGGSTHAFGVAEAIELARSLGRLPRCVVYGVQGADFDSGTGLSDPVRDALPDLGERLLEECRLAIERSDPGPS